MRSITLYLLLVSVATNAQSDPLDTTFGSTGWVVTNTGTSGESYAVDVQDDGRIVVAGTINEHFGLVRYMPDGSTDPSFGTNGKVESTFAAARGVDMVIQSDGRIIVAGEIPGVSFVIARYDENGALDTTFSGDGWATTNIDVTCVSTSARAMALQPDGRIVLAGNAQFGSQQDVALARFNTDGSLDASFGGDGTVVLSWGPGDDVATDVIVQADGHILLTGTISTVPQDAALVRLMPDGSLDASFGTDGLVVTDVNGAMNTDVSLGLDVDGNVLAVGTVSTGSGHWAATLTRHLPDGGLDPTFGTDGSSVSPVLDTFDPMSVLVDAQQRILIGGRAMLFASYPRMAILRYLADGTIDGSFADQGVLTASFGVGMNDEARSMCLDEAGRLLVTGVHIYNINADNAFFAARFLTGDPSGMAERRQHMDPVIIQQGPGDGMFTLRSFAQAPLAWSLIDPLGRCVRAAQRIGPFATVPLDLRSAATGTYYVVASSVVDRHVIRFLVQH